MTMNYTDVAVVLIIAICVFKSGTHGITHFAVSVFGKIISLFLSLTLYGPVSGFLRNTPVFDFLKAQIEPIVDVGALLETIGISSKIMANDNSEIYKLFQVETFEDYITSYIANSALNILSVIIVYMCISVVISLLFRANRIVSGLPLIKGINGIAGVLAGLIEGILIIWLLIVVLIFFNLQGKLLNIYDMLLQSKLAIYFLHYNIFVDAIFRVTP